MSTISVNAEQPVQTIQAGGSARPGNVTTS